MKYIQDICLNFNLVDIWLVRNPDVKRFTWRQESPFIQQRLDFWLPSNSYQDEVEIVDIFPSINSDHSAIVLSSSSIEEQRHGPSYWKFNTSLLDDHDFIELIAESIPIWQGEFRQVNDKRVFGTSLNTS